MSKELIQNEVEKIFKTKSDNYSSELANEHWDWLSSLLGHVYRDALVHGYKHGYEAGMRDANLIRMMKPSDFVHEEEQKNESD